MHSGGVREEELDIVPFALKAKWKYDVVVDAQNAIVVRGDPKPKSARSVPQRLLVLAERHDPVKHRGSTYKIVDGRVLRITDLGVAEDELRDDVVGSEGVRLLTFEIGKAVSSIYKRAFSTGTHPDGPFVQVRTADAVDLILDVHAQSAPASLADISKHEAIVAAIAKIARATRAPARVNIDVDLDTGEVSKAAKRSKARGAHDA